MADGGEGEPQCREQVAEGADYHGLTDSDGLRDRPAGQRSRGSAPRKSRWPAELTRPNRECPSLMLGNSMTGVSVSELRRA